MQFVGHVEISVEAALDDLKIQVGRPPSSCMERVRLLNRRFGS